MLVLSCGNNKTESSENLSYPDKLIGVEIRYTYTGGNEYAVKFEEEGVSYQFRSGSKPDKWWGKYPHNHMITTSNEHLVSWHEPKKGDYVTLLINFEKNLLYGSAILGGKKVHFQEATIHEIKKP